MAVITHYNKYLFSVWEILCNRFYPLSKVKEPDIKLKSEGDFWKFDIKIGNKENPFFISKNGLKKYELLWTYKEAFCSALINPHSYVRKETPVKKGDIVVDAGSCEGFFARYALNMGAGKVILIEPCEKLALGLEKTFKSDIERGKVYVIRAGLGNKRKRETLMINKEMYCSGNLAKLNNAGKTIVEEQIELRKLDEIVFNIIGGYKVNLIKMDIEGAEIEAIRGASKIIKRSKPRLMIASYRQWENSILVDRICMKMRWDYKKKICGCNTEEKPARPYMMLFY